jgi:hypothetical protein
MALSGIPAGPEFSQNQAPDLAALLDKAAAYCRKLEGAALDYICKEEIVEVTDPRLDLIPSTMPTTTSTTAVPAGGSVAGTPLTQTTDRLVRSTKKVKQKLLYDYQCIRSGGEIREVRHLLEENGQKKNEPDAKLKTMNFLFGYVLMSPVSIFAERFHADFDYKVAGTAKIKKRPVVIVDVTPKPDVPETQNLYGKAWIDSATGDILRIQWSEKRVNHYEITASRALLYDRKPRLIIRSEFQVEKNGIRFPSKLFIEEAYVSKGGLVFVRSETTVNYEDFKFFTVATDSQILR